MVVAKFGNLVDEIQKLSTEDKEELKFLLEKYLIEEKRKTILRNFKKARKEEKAGKLDFSNNINMLKESLEA